MPIILAWVGEASVFTYTPLDLVIESSQISFTFFLLLLLLSPAWFGSGWYGYFLLCSRRSICTPIGGRCGVWNSPPSIGRASASFCRIGLGSTTNCRINCRPSSPSLRWIDVSPSSGRLGLAHAREPSTLAAPLKNSLGLWGMSVMLCNFYELMPSLGLMEVGNGVGIVIDSVCACLVVNFFLIYGWWSFCVAEKACLPLYLTLMCIIACRDCKLLSLLGVFAKESYILYCPEWKKAGRWLWFLQFPLIGHLPFP